MTRSEENSVGIVQTKTMRVVEPDTPLKLECGKRLGPIDVAYETYGEINVAGDNIILICHALNGNAHVAGFNSPDVGNPAGVEIDLAFSDMFIDYGSARVVLSISHFSRP